MEENKKERGVNDHFTYECMCLLATSNGCSEM